MIEYKIIRNNNNYYVNISGHSGHAKEGYDVVCASVSTLTITIINVIDDLGYGYNIKNLKKNNGFISFDIENSNEVIDKIMKTFTDSLNDLANQYPSNVKNLN